MIALDTNILVRFFTQDDEDQSKLANKLIDKYSSQKSKLFISNIVFCELVSVLTRGYKYSRKDILSLIKSMLSTSEFAFEDNRILWISVIEAEKNDADITDIVIGNINKSKMAKTTYTFDRKASMLENFELVS